MTQARHGLLAVLFGLAFAVLLARLLVAGHPLPPGIAPHRILLSCAVAALLYLMSHAMRAARLAAISMTLLGASFRTVFLMNLFVAPWSILLPFKLDELIRLATLSSVGRSPVRALVAIIIDRSMDGAVLVLIALFMAANGHGREVLPTGLLGLLALSATLVFLMAPYMLTIIQRYIMMHHYKPRAILTLRVVNSLRALATLGYTTIKSMVPILIVSTLGIWILEITAVGMGEYALGLSPLDLLKVLGDMLSRVDDGWRLFWQAGPAAPPILLFTASFLLGLLVIWPLAALAYVARRGREQRDASYLVRASSVALPIARRG